MSSLSISRRFNEEVCIGDDIVIRIGRIRGNQVILQIMAPQHIRIDRSEIRKKKDAGKDVP